jgi:hypothetical protein
MNLPGVSGYASNAKSKYKKHTLTAESVYDAIGPARSTRTQMFELNTLKLAFSSDSVHAAMDKLAIRLNGIGILVKNHLPQKLIFVHRAALDFHIFWLLQTIQSS